MYSASGRKRLEYHVRLLAFSLHSNWTFLTYKSNAAEFALNCSDIEIWSLQLSFLLVDANAFTQTRNYWQLFSHIDEVLTHLRRKFKSSVPTVTFICII
jgi:hypothetical protein